MVATCTTIIVLAPLALMPGMGGFLFRPLALAVAFAMLASFLLSRTFVPMMCAKFLPDEHRQGHGTVTAASHGPDAARPPAGSAASHQRFEHFLDPADPALRAAAGLRPAASPGGAGRRAGCCSSARWRCCSASAGSSSRRWTPARSPSTCARRRTCGWTPPSSASPRSRSSWRSEIPADEREMIVSELGLDPDWSAAYTANSGQQDAVIRVQLTEKRTSTAPRSTPSSCGTPSPPSRDFADLRVSFDTGGMVSTALNYGASSPIDIQIEGGTRRAGAASWPRRSADAGRRASTGGRRAHAPAPRRPVPDHRRRPPEGGQHRPVGPRRHPAGGGRHELQRVDQPQLLDRREERQPVLRRRPVPGGPQRARSKTLLNIFATGAKQTEPVSSAPWSTLHTSTGAVEVNHVSLYRTFNVLVNTENRDIGGVAARHREAAEGHQTVPGRACASSLKRRIRAA